MPLNLIQLGSDLWVDPNEIVLVRREYRTGPDDIQFEVTDIELRSGQQFQVRMLLNDFIALIMRWSQETQGMTYQPRVRIAPDGRKFEE